VRHNIYVPASGGADEAKTKKGWLARGKAADEAVIEIEKRRHGPGRLLVSFVLLAIVAGIALWFVPLWQLQPAHDRLNSESQLTPAERLVLDADVFRAENAAR
jgi:hypothetical protein